MLQRVAIVIERADVALGGAERSMAEVSQALSDLGLKVTLLAATGASKTPQVRVLCPGAPGRRVGLSVFGRALTQHLKEHHYDIVHSVLPFDFCDVYQPRGGTYAEAIRRNIASYPSGPIRWFKQATAAANRRRARLLNCERKLCQRPDGPVIAALSQYVARQLPEHYRTDPQRITLVPNGVKTDQPVDEGAVTKLRAHVQRTLGAQRQGDAVSFLFAARNFRLKGLRCLLEALSVTLRATGDRRIGLLVVGAGQIPRYRRLARRLGAAHRTVFLGPLPDIHSALPLADVGILPTFYDPSSRFILETLVLGKPVITTRYNGAADHFTDGRHGKIIDAPENISALTEAMRYFSNPAHITLASRAIAEDNLRERISVRRVARDLVCLYESIVAKKGRTRCTQSL